MGKCFRPLEIKGQSMLLLRFGHDLKLTSPWKGGTNADAMMSSSSCSRLRWGLTCVAWAVTSPRAIDGALEGVPINVLFSEEKLGDRSGTCEDVEGLEGRRGLVGVRDLLSEEDIGVGGGSRKPAVRRDARVERVGGDCGAERECASQFSHLMGCLDERRPSWESSGIRKIIADNEGRAANASQIIPRV